MSDNFTRYATSGNRQLSPQIWKNCPKAQILSGHLDKGWGFVDDFHTLPTGVWTVTQAGSAGTAVLGDVKGGVLIINAGHTDAGDGANVQRSNTTVGESFNCQYGEVFFETLLYMTACATADVFVGLSVIDTTILTSVPAVSAYSIGFRSLTRDGVWLSGTYSASGTATGTGFTPTASKWYKLGFKVKMDDKVEFYVDGVKVNEETTYISTTEMVPSFVCQSGGTNQPTMNIDWVACFQAENLARTTV